MDAYLDELEKRVNEMEHDRVVSTVLPTTVLSAPSSAASSPTTSNHKGSTGGGATRKKRHWGSVTDLTPEAILTEDSSSSDEEEESRSMRTASVPTSPAMSAVHYRSNPQEDNKAATTGEQKRDLALDILEELGTR